MLFYLKKIVSALVLPPTSLILLALFGLWLTKKRPRVGRALAIFSLITLLILSIPIVSDNLLQSLETIPPIANAQLDASQAIVILGGGKNSRSPEFDYEDTDNRATLQRLRYGAYLQQKTGAPILVTGGAPFGGQSEASTMAKTLKRDFHAHDVWTEEQSKDTSENATYSAAILKNKGIEQIALVSHAWHLPRAKMLFEMEGITVYPAPTGYTSTSNDLMSRLLPSASALENSATALKEYLGLLSSWLKFRQFNKNQIRLVQHLFIGPTR